MDYSGRVPGIALTVARKSCVGFWEEALLEQDAEAAGFRQNGGERYVGGREGIHSDGDKTCE